jgi:hypothetical protein
MTRDRGSAEDHSLGRLIWHSNVRVDTVPGNPSVTLRGRRLDMIAATGEWADLCSWSTLLAWKNVQARGSETFANSPMCTRGVSTYTRMPARCVRGVSTSSVFQLKPFGFVGRRGTTNV